MIPQAVVGPRESLNMEWEQASGWLGPRRRGLQPGNVRTFIEAAGQEGERAQTPNDPHETIT